MGFFLLVCVRSRLFLKQELIGSSIVPVTLKEWLALRDKQTVKKLIAIN